AASSASLATSVPTTGPDQPSGAGAAQEWVSSGQAGAASELVGASATASQLSLSVLQTKPLAHWSELEQRASLLQAAPRVRPVSKSRTTLSGRSDSASERDIHIFSHSILELSRSGACPGLRLSVNL